MMPTVPIRAATPRVIPAIDTNVLSEIVRLQAEADRRFAGVERTNALLDEAQRIATDQAALLVLERIARSRAAFA